MATRLLSIARMATSLSRVVLFIVWLTLPPATLENARLPLSATTTGLMALVVWLVLLLLLLLLDGILCTLEKLPPGFGEPDTLCDPVQVLMGCEYAHQIRAVDVG